MELDDYVCPLDLDIPSALQSFVAQRNRRNVDKPVDDFPEPRRRSNSEEVCVCLVRVTVTVTVRSCVCVW